MDSRKVVTAAACGVAACGAAAAYFWWRSSKEAPLPSLSASYRTPNRASPSPKSRSVTATPQAQGSGTSALGGSSNEGVIDPSSVLIVYGSNTGTAEQFAKDLEADGRRKGFTTTITDGTGFATDPDAPLGAHRNIVFIVATYGEGDPTDDFRDALKTLQMASPAAAKALKERKRVAVFGLGDRQYKYYCKAATDLEAALTRLNCEKIIETALGDARGELEATFDEWREQLWSSLAAKIGVALSSAPLEPQYKFNVLPAGALPDPAPFPAPASAVEPTKARPIRVPVAAVRELLFNNESHGRSTKHVEIDLSSVSNVAYQAGDHCGIYPCNPDDVVQAYLDRLGVDAETADRVVELTKDVETRSGAKRPVNQLPARVTLRMGFKRYLNLCGPPKRATLRVCAQYCTDEKEKEAFSALVAPTTDPAVFRETLNRCRTVLGFLREFPSCQVPLGHFVEAMPPIAPRFFSIASDQLHHPKAIHLAVGIVEGGLCSGMIANLKPGDELTIFVRKSTFHLPMRQKGKPLILIGPGTGIAPFIGFCQRRQAWFEKSTPLGPCTLYFGCRRREEDFIYRDNLESWAREGSAIITKLRVAFSRDQAEKVYVQHLIHQDAQAVYDALVRDGAYLFICGDATHMAKDVEETILGVLQACGGMSRDAAVAKIKALETEGRYLKDVWAA